MLLIAVTTTQEMLSHVFVVRNFYSYNYFFTKTPRSHMSVIIELAVPDSVARLAVVTPCLFGIRHLSELEMAAGNCHWPCTPHPQAESITREGSLLLTALIY